MKLASYSISGEPTWGTIENEHAVNLGAVLGKQYPDLKSLIAAGAYSEIDPALASAPRNPLSSITWLPVIPNPSKILCVGLNYEKHRAETGRAVVGFPTIFTRFPNTQIGHMANIVRPRNSTDLDYEGELALIIGRPGRHISRENVFDHIAGYACYNDASIRDFQYHTPQFTPGKNFPRTGSFGPWMATPDELGELGSLRISTTLNGQVVQEAELGQMIFDIPAIVSYCSSFNPLEPGDVIVTGTPGGVGAKRTPPLWMKPGDVVEVAIERLGVLRNTVVDEA